LERIIFSRRIQRKNFHSAHRHFGGVRIVILAHRLRPTKIGIHLTHMLRWRATMRELSAEARLHFYARSLSRRSGRGLHAAALYGSLAMIAAVVFGTLSVHPF
jgi:hypothetical protein